LAAILAADAVGYSRMMRDDEAGTLALLQKHCSEVIYPGIAKHQGRVVKLIGDGLLAEFSSVVEAVDGAAEIQRAMAARNGGLQSQHQMESMLPPASKELPKGAASASHDKSMIRFRES
jgi:adenylate cyclase